MHDDPVPGLFSAPAPSARLSPTSRMGFALNINVGTCVLRLLNVHLHGLEDLTSM
jgi:hypothetical protein